MDGGPLDPRFHDDNPKTDDDIEAMDIEKQGGHALTPPSRYDLIMRQLSQALNERETALSGRPQGERSTVQTFSLPASHQEVTDNKNARRPGPGPL